MFCWIARLQRIMGSIGSLSRSPCCNAAGGTWDFGILDRSMMSFYAVSTLPLLLCNSAYHTVVGFYFNKEFCMQQDTKFTNVLGVIAGYKFFKFYLVSKGIKTLTFFGIKR